MRKCLAVILPILFVLSACSANGKPANNSDSGQPIELQFLTWQTEEAGIKDWWFEMIDQFEKNHPNVKIKPIHAMSTDVPELLTQRFAAGNPPQIIHLPTEQVAVFASQNLLEPLDDYLKGTDILENWPAVQDMMKYNGKYYGVVTLAYPVNLWYNEQALTKAGIKVPTTPQEFLDAAQKLNKDGQFGFGTVTKEERDMFRQASAQMVGFGGAWTRDGQFTFLEPNAVAGIDNWRKSAKFSPEGVGNADKAELFFVGKIAMMIDGPFHIPSVANAPKELQPYLKTARIPFDTVPFYPGNNLHIPATIPDNEKKLAWDFIDQITRPENQDRFVELYNSPAPRKGAGEGLKTSPLLDVFLQTSAQSVSVFPDSPAVLIRFGEFMQIINEALKTMLTSDAPTQEILQQAKVKLDAAGIKP